MPVVPLPVPVAEAGRTRTRYRTRLCCSVAASVLTTASSMLRDGVEYHDLGPDHFDRTDTSKTVIDSGGSCFFLLSSF